MRNSLAPSFKHHRPTSRRHPLAVDALRRPTIIPALAAALPAAMLFLFALPAHTAALDHVVFRHEGAERTESGRVLVADDEGGVLLQSRTGRLWTVEAKDVASRTTDEAPFVPFTKDEMAERLLARLPRGFASYETAHYLILHNSSRPYASWCGALFERLYRAFFNFWERKGFALHDPDFPLVALVFADKESYAAYSRDELGEGAEAIIGYYSIGTNRMAMYDLTGVATLRRPGDQRLNSAQINAMLARPRAERTVATVIHEATHQIAFNCGLQTRYADIPVWVSEGIAVYFETPDLKSRQGWRTIGGVNRVRLDAFKKYVRERPPESLKTLIANDERFRSTQQAYVAYAEAWALKFYLIRHKTEELTAYLKKLAAKQQLDWDKPEERLAEFEEAFGDLDTLDAEFLRYMRRLR